MSSAIIISLISALTAVLSVAIGWSTYKLASSEQRRSFEQWLAANEPWLRISFEHHTDEDLKGCFMAGYPSYVRIQNQGKIPCRIESVRLGGEVMRGRLRKSSVSDTSIGGTLDGARMAPGETLHFRLSGTENLIGSITSNGDPVGSRTKRTVPMEVVYSYEPERRRLLKADVKLIASKKWTLLRVIDSSVMWVATS